MNGAHAHNSHGTVENWEALKGLCADSAGQQPNAEAVLGKAPRLYVKETRLLILGRCSEEQGLAFRGRRLAGTAFLVALCLAKAGRCYLIFFSFFSVFQVGATLYSVQPVGTIFVPSHSSIPKWQCLPERIFYTRLLHQFLCLVTCFFLAATQGTALDRLALEASEIAFIGSYGAAPVRESGL